MITRDFYVSGMTCAACQANVQRKMLATAGVSAATVDLLGGKMKVTFNETVTDENALCRAVNAIGYRATPFSEQGESAKARRKKQKEKEQKETDLLKNRLLFSVILLFPLMYLSMGHMAGLPLPGFLSAPLPSALLQGALALCVIIINRRFFVRGFRGIAKGAPNMDSLVALGSSASFLYGVYNIAVMIQASTAGNTEQMTVLHGKLFFESAAMILTLVTVGKYAEQHSRAKTGDALDSLLHLAPQTARVVTAEGTEEIPVDRLQIGNTVRIKPGDVLPADGVVLSGNGSVDQSPITGESIPAEKAPGDRVMGACINKNGTFDYRAEQVGEGTAFAKIVALVENAGSTKAPVARLADKISGIFVPIVSGIALVTVIAWLLLGKDLSFALTCGISVLVISCPCALGLATPVAVTVGTGKAAECGILIKSAEALENLHRIDTVVMDKTGTVTLGEPRVTDILLLDSTFSKKDFLTLAAACEQGSEHPLAKAVLQAARGITLPPATDFSAQAGQGVTAAVQKKQIAAGNAAHMDKLCKTDVFTRNSQTLAAAGKTALCFACDGKPLGILAVQDTVRKDSAYAVAQFKSMHIQPVLLTGDNALTAQSVARSVGIEDCVSDVLPAQKQEEIQRRKEQGAFIAMLGDGINDAPALTLADVGIAMGSGTDIAGESADIVLMKSSLADGVTAVELSKAVMRNIRENLFWAFFYNCIGIPVAAGVLYPLWGITLSPMFSAAAMSLSSLCVVTNALRLRKFRAKKSTQEEKGMVINMKKILTVEGMMCNHCKMHVENALKAVEGVTDVAVDLENKTATVTLLTNVENDTLAKAITDAGYAVTQIA